MKKTIFLISIGLLCAFFACADSEQAVGLENLPLKTRQFMAETFPDVKVAYATREREMFEVEYEVMLVNGVKMEFNGDGEWKKIDCHYSQLPIQVVPAQILRKVEDLYPGIIMTGIERDKRRIEVDLANGLELKFDNRYNLLEIDD